MSEPRKKTTWLVLIPEGDEVQFAKSPMADGKVVISDMDSVRAMFTKATHQAFFGIPIYKAEIGPIKLLDDIEYHVASPRQHGKDFVTKLVNDQIARRDAKEAKRDEAQDH